MDKNQPIYLFEKAYKSEMGAIIIAALLGPIGLLYGSTIGGIILSVVFFLAFSVKSVFPFASSFLLIIVWMTAIFWNTITVKSQNKKLIAQSFSNANK